MRFLKLICSITLLTVMFWIGGIAADIKYLQDAVVFLKISPNTQSKYDQQVSDAVADAIYGYYDNLNWENAEFCFSPQMITNIAYETLREQGDSSDVAVTATRKPLSTLATCKVSLPTGVYHIISVLIGDGEGAPVYGVILDTSNSGKTQPKLNNRLLHTLRLREGYKMRFYVMQLIGQTEKMLYTHCN